MRLAPQILLAALFAAPVFAQSNPPQPPPRPKPADAAKVREETARLNEEIHRLEKALLDSPDDEAAAKMRAEMAALVAKRADLKRRMDRTAAGMGPDDENRHIDPRLELEKLEAEAKAADDAGDEERARALRDKAMMLRRSMDEAGRRPGGEEFRGPGDGPPDGPRPGGGPGMGPEGRDPWGGPGGQGPNGPPTVARPGGPRPGPLTPEDRERAIAWLKENEPTRFERLEEMKKNKPQDHERVLNQTAAEVRDLLSLKQADPERYARRLESRKLEVKSGALVEKIRAAQQPADVEAAKKELKEALAKLFDLREADKEQEIKRLEDEISKLRDTLKKRKDAKESIVERRVNELLGQDDDMRW